MTKNTLGVLIHGAGWVSGEHIKAFTNNPHTNVVAISSRNLDSCKQRMHEAGLTNVTCYTDFEKALRHEGVDIVSICTPQHLHAENTLAAAEAGKHIVIEKPVAISVSELVAMRKAIRKAGVKTIVSFVLRWNPLFETIKALITDGALGEIYYTESDYQHTIGSRWKGFSEGRTKSQGVSAMLLAGCHAVDTARWFAASGEFQAAVPIEVFAYAGGFRKGKEIEFDYATNRWRPAPPLEYDDLEVLLVRYSNGAMSKITANFGCIMPYNFPISIFGTRGTVKDNRVWSHKFPGQTSWVQIPSILPDSGDVSHHPFQGEIDHFVDCILSNRESHCNFEDALHTHSVIFAALQCYETRQPVKLPLPELATI